MGMLRGRCRSLLCFAALGFSFVLPTRVPSAGATEGGLSLTSTPRPITPQSTPTFRTLTPTPGATRTATPTSSTGSLTAGNLVARAQAAFSRRGPVHFKGTMTGTMGGAGTVRQTEYGDLRLGTTFVLLHDTIRERSAVRSGRRTRIRTRYREFVRTERGTAIRSGRRSRWSCQGRSGSLPTAVDPASGISMGKSLAYEMLIGSDLLDNIPVWHVQIAGGLLLGSDRFIEDVDIAQSGGLVLRKEITSTVMYGPTKGRRTHITVRYSHYGERIAISLPAACRR